MASDPFTNARQGDEQVRNQLGFDIGKVIAVSPENHMVAVEDATHSGGAGETRGTPTSAAVPVGNKGDVTLPSVGDMVMIARFRNNKAVVLSTYYTQQPDIPTAEEGERVVGHPESDSEVRLKPNGDVVINPERNVVIDGGGTKVVTDVETTTDADGHVTSITVVRADSTEVNSQ